MLDRFLDRGKTRTDKLHHPRIANQFGMSLTICQAKFAQPKLLGLKHEFVRGLHPRNCIRPIAPAHTLWWRFSNMNRISGDPRCRRPANRVAWVRFAPLTDLP